jgi:hypothetical protein
MWIDRGIPVSRGHTIGYRYVPGMLELTDYGSTRYVTHIGLVERQQDLPWGSRRIYEDFDYIDEAFHLETWRPLLCPIPAPPPPPLMKVIKPMWGRWGCLVFVLPHNFWNRIIILRLKQKNMLSPTFQHCKPETIASTMATIPGDIKVDTPIRKTMTEKHSLYDVKVRRKRRIKQHGLHTAMLRS